MEPVQRVRIYLPLAALFVSFGGLFAAATLSLGHLLKLAVPCGPGGGCAAVAAHSSSVILGIPIAYFGVGAYACAIWLLWQRPMAISAGYLLVAITGLGTLVSTGLVWYAQTVIGATCTWCLVSGAAMATLFVFSILLARSGRPRQA